MSSPWLIRSNSPSDTRALQGMARALSGQGAAWPLVFDRSVRSGVKRDFESYVRLEVGR